MSVTLPLASLVRGLAGRETRFWESGQTREGNPASFCPCLHPRDAQSAARGLCQNLRCCDQCVNLRRDGTKRWLGEFCGVNPEQREMLDALNYTRAVVWAHFRQMAMQFEDRSTEFIVSTSLPASPADLRAKDWDCGFQKFAASRSRLRTTDLLAAGRL